MKFLLDENVDFRVAHFLEEQRHNVTTVARDYFYGVADEDVLAMAHQEQRVLITNDKDFGELIFRQHFPHAGVILFRRNKGDIALDRMKDHLIRALAEYEDQLTGCLVITSKDVKVRHTARAAEKAA